MAGQPAVAHVRDRFLIGTESAQALVLAVRDVAAVRQVPGQPRLHPEQARRVVELAFLGMISAWEEFLERSFVRYLAGATSDSGYQPRLRLSRANSIAHSYHLLSGDPDFDPTRNYAKFSDYRWVVAIAKVYFDHGAPYSQLLHANLDVLSHATKLRNRVAHGSTKTREDFKRSARVHLGLQDNAPLQQGYGVGDLLMQRAERLFGQEMRDQNLPYFMAYALRLRYLARQICPVP